PPIAAPAQSAGWLAYLDLRKYPAYLLVVAGYTAQTFAMGGFSSWVSSFFHEVHQMDLERADFYFGVALAITGLLATLIGGFLATRWQQRTGTGYVWVLALSGILSAPFAFGTFATVSTALSWVMIIITMFLLFLSTGPVNTLILETVPVNMRATSM